MKRCIVLSFSGDITIKSDKVSVAWQKVVLGHVKTRIGDRGDIELFHSRIVIYPRDDKVASEIFNDMRTIFGLSAIYLGYEVETSPDKILNALKSLKDLIGDFSLSVLKAVGLGGDEKKIVEEVLKSWNGASSELKQRIFLEIRGDKTFLFEDELFGVGGLPFGVSGKLVSLISGGPDSILSSWLMMKRGSKIIGVYVPIAGVEARKRAIDSARILFSKWTPDRSGKLYVLPMEKLLNRIADVGGEDSSHILFKRYLLRIGEIIGLFEGARGIVTGELSGEHASQTIWNLGVITAAAKNLPVYRPVIGFDKSEVLNKLRDIDEELFEVVNKRVEECTRIIPKKPKTKVDPIEIRKLEKMVGFTPRELLNMITKDGKIYVIKNFEIVETREIRIPKVVRERILKKLGRL